MFWALNRLCAICNMTSALFCWSADGTSKGMGERSLSPSLSLSQQLSQTYQFCIRVSPSVPHAFITGKLHLTMGKSISKRLKIKYSILVILLTQNIFFAECKNRVRGTGSWCKFQMPFNHTAPGVVCPEENTQIAKRRCIAILFCCFFLTSPFPLKQGFRNLSICKLTHSHSV